MFQTLGKIVSRHTLLWLLGWAAVAVVLGVYAPRVEEVIKEGEFNFLPDTEPGRRAEALYSEAFPDDLFKSTVVIVVRRNNSPDDKLLAADRTFIEQSLKPRIERIQPVMDLAAAYARLSPDFADAEREINEELDGLPHELALGVVRDWHADVFRAPADPDPDTDAATPLTERARREAQRRRVPAAALGSAWQRRLAAPAHDTAGPDRWTLSTSAVANLTPPAPIIADVRTYTDESLGHMLDSADGKATLVFVELTTEFLERANRQAISRIERLIPRSDGGESELGDEMPLGTLDVAMSGSATVGRDMRAAAEQSARTIDLVTISLVLVLLLAIYRAPVLAIIPLITVGLAVHVALRSLACLSELGLVDLFSSVKIYITVVLYGAGVDYCMFLMARYKEELDEGASLREAMAHSVDRVGTALAASAGTTIVGIGMMAFAEFGKFQQAGISMAFSLIFVLLAALTFTPALLMLAGRWAFWPHIRSERLRTGMGWFSPTSLVARVLERDLIGRAWRQIGRALVARPGTILLASIALMLPFAVVAVVFFDNRSYGLLSDLPQDEPAVVGAKVVQRHFPAGQAGPMTVLIQNPDVDFRVVRDAEGRPGGRELIQELVERLYLDRARELGIADIRSIAYPFGMTETGKDAFAAKQRRGLAATRQKAENYYISRAPGLDGRVTRLDVVFDFDPFQRESIRRFEQFREAVAAELPAGLGQPVEEFRDGSHGKTRLLYRGTTADIRDLKAVTGRDQIRIDVLVLAGVFAVLVLLLRRVAISAYLIVSVFFSYLVTLGVTFAVFWALDPAGFAGLDWKVPVFLFTILIAVGEDYNIYLITRIDEEQQRHGSIHGITVALSRTGKIISSCGLIMAGTFSALLSATLVGMQQLGFALAFGVLLDTFVVRPILVPAYLILLNSGRFGVLGRWLGAQVDRPALAPVRIAPESDRQGRRAG
ncbi:MAG TPA: MMPL family transporter [Planctomycetaceae bacterium]|nr:MMPL family transporter [Planctomycetaceae bacterium]